MHVRGLINIVYTKNIGVKWSEARRDFISQAFQYTVYMHDLSVLLNNSNIDGKIGGILVNHLSYAGDMCLVSLSSRGMIQLVNICDNFAISHCLTYNIAGADRGFFPRGCQFALK